MPDAIIFILGVVVTLFAVVAVVLIGMSEAQDLREAGLLDTDDDGDQSKDSATSRPRSLQGEQA